MTEEEKFLDRALGMVAEEMLTNPLGLWYVSYADDKFLGSVYIEAYGPTSAVMRAQAFKLSPGGEAMMVGPIPAAKIPDRKFWNRLLTREEVQEASGEECKTIREWDAEESE